MKRILLAWAIAMMSLPIAQEMRADTDVSIDYFYNNLNDGNWIEVADYGYCWQPNVALENSDWRPYSDGYWVYTDVGWTWVSNEDFGWATYHYGRWLRLEDQGWAWVPGYEWGPAWVSWRTGGDYVGWAPLPPRHEHVYEGRAITGHVDVEFDIGPLYYNFVDVRYIGEPVLRERIVPVAQNVTVIYNTVNVTNITYNNSIVYNYGPDYDRVCRYSVRPVQRLTLERENHANLATGVTTQSVTRVEGQKLVVAAPQKIQQASKAVAPKNVKARVTQAKVERGWSGVKDPQTKNNLVQKMKSEDAKKVPPPTSSPNQQAAAAPPTPATAASPATARATAAPGKPTAATSATPVRPTPAAKAMMTPHRGEEGSMPGVKPPVIVPPVTTSGDDGTTQGQRERNRQAQQAQNARARHQGKGEGPRATPRTIQNPQRSAAAAALATEEQLPAGKKGGRGHERANQSAETDADQPGRSQGRHQQQNELAPTGQADNPQMHKRGGNQPHVQGQPPTAEGRQGGGHEKKKGGEASPTPHP